MKRALFATAAVTLGVLAVGGPALADDPTPAANVSSAGTTFLNAVQIGPDQPVSADGVTGDYMYWSFGATAGQRPEVTANVTLPDAADRHGAEAWTVEVFDGLRRRQPCVDGQQSPVVAADATTVALGCRLRQVRSWAEPSDTDPLPGTYYVRLSMTTVPEQDLGLPVKVNLTLAAPKGDIGADEGTLSDPLNPLNRPGSVITTDPSTTVGATQEADSSWSWDWLPDFSARWFWTAGGGILAAIAGLVGFSFTRRRV